MATQLFLINFSQLFDIFWTTVWWLPLANQIARIVGGRDVNNDQNANVETDNYASRSSWVRRGNLWWTSIASRESSNTPSIIWLIRMVVFTLHTITLQLNHNNCYNNYYSITHIATTCKILNLTICNYTPDKSSSSSERGSCISVNKCSSAYLLKIKQKYTLCHRPVAE